jgi:hypothetical protein
VKCPLGCEKSVGLILIVVAQLMTLDCYELCFRYVSVLNPVPRTNSFIIDIWS